MESERPIEKLLRAFAKKRRDEAGPPFELGAQARRQLLKEVQRRHQPAAEGFFRGVIPLPRLAFVLSVVALAAVLAALMLPALSKAKSKAQRTRVLSQQRPARRERELRLEELPAPQPVTAPPMSRAPQSLPVAKMEISGSGTVSLTNSASTLTIANGNAASAPMTHGLGGRNSFDDSLQGTAITFSAISTNYFAYDQAAAQKPTDSKVGEFKADAAPAKLLDKLFAEPAESGPAISHQYRQVRPREQDNPQPTSPVLSSFDFEVNGSKVQVRDQDGSVYQGNLKTDAVLTVSLSTAVTKPKQSGEGRSGGSGAAGYFFRVSGTNRTLNQTIVFAGNLVAATNTAEVSASNGVLSTNRPVSDEAWPGNLDISGVLTIDGKDTEIHAAPMSP